jgi:hypothetical protein
VLLDCQESPILPPSPTEGRGVGGATAEASRRERIVTRIVRTMIKMRLLYFSKISVSKSLKIPVNFSAG